MTTKMQPKAGQSVCFLAKNKKPREYGGSNNVVPIKNSSADKKASANMTANHQQLLQKIEDCEEDYLTQLAEGIQAKVAAQAKKRKKSKVPRKKSKRAQRGNKAGPPPAIPIGTKVSRYFKNSQAYIQRRNARNSTKVNEAMVQKTC
jgi:hypothetical protein